VFLTLFGEELGDLGSRYYCQHPVFPLAKTVADINLEQLGRTDDTEGPRPLQFNLTGFDYTDIAAYLSQAGEETGIRVVKDKKNSDSFFARSDNAAFANAGVPSTTLFGRLHLSGFITAPATSGPSSTTTTWPRWMARWRWVCSALRTAPKLRGGTRTIPRPVAMSRPGRSSDTVGQPILAAAAFQPASRLKGGCGQDCAPHYALRAPRFAPALAPCWTNPGRFGHALRRKGSDRE